MSSSYVPQKAEILLSGYLQWVNLFPLFSVLFNISILTLFLYMNLITLTLQFLFLHFGQVTVFTMLPGLNNAKGCNGHGCLWETVEGFESVCLVWFFSSCFICMLFQKCNCWKRPVQPFSSVGSRIIASEDTQDLISSRNCLEVEYA